ncbi:MAG: hypothetical protein M1836_005843 [Candelina mexicana]|nr:MAG: hypothetical protein M1836_005843 [Candelina mexicana]
MQQCHEYLPPVNQPYPQALPRELTSDLPAAILLLFSHLRSPHLIEAIHQEKRQYNTESQIAMMSFKVMGVFIMVILMPKAYSLCDADYNWSNEERRARQEK